MKISIKEAIAIVFKMKEGTKTELLKIIDEECYLLMTLNGLITQNEQWTITDAGKEEYEFFHGVLSEEEKTLAQIFAPFRFKKQESHSS